jgi:hypothetical protein
MRAQLQWRGLAVAKSPDVKREKRELREAMRQQGRTDFPDYEEMDEEDAEEEPLDEKQAEAMGELREFDKSILPHAPKDRLENAPPWLKEWPTQPVQA